MCHPPHVAVTLYEAALLYNQFLYIYMTLPRIDILAGDLQAHSEALRPCNHY